MAAAVVITVPAWLWLRETWNDVSSQFLSETEYEGVIAAHTNTSPTAQTYSAESVGGGFWRSSYGVYLAHAAMTTTGAADHLYLLYPDGSVRAAAVVRTSQTMDAPTGNDSTELIDAAVDFTTSTAVAENDLVVLTGTGATARVQSVAATTLTTSDVTMGQKYVAGRAYTIVRPPGTDTTSTLSLTGRPIMWREAQRGIGERLLQHLSTQRAAGYGGSATTPPEVANIRQRLCELRGVIGR